MTYSTRDIAGFKTRVQAEFKKNPLWSVVASDTKWFCPYCAEEGVERWPKDESGRVDAMTEHLTKSCAEWSEFRGKYKSAAVLARKKQVRELRTKVKKALVTRKEWQFSDVERAWYCPYCVKETKAQIPADRQMNEECLQGIIDHVEVCFEYKRRKGKEQDFQFIQSTVTRENQKKKLRAKVRKQLEDETPVWSQRNNEGLWICPYCHAAQATIDITSPFARRENAPRQIADHLVLTCEEHAKGGPPTMLGGDLPSEEVLTLESSDRVEAPAKKPSSTRRKDPAEARTAGGAKPGSGVKTDNRGRPASAAKRPSDPAAQRTSDPAAKRPSDSAAKRPSDPAPRRTDKGSARRSTAAVDENELPPQGSGSRGEALAPPNTKAWGRDGELAALGHGLTLETFNSSGDAELISDVELPSVLRTQRFDQARVEARAKAPPQPASGSVSSPISGSTVRRGTMASGAMADAGLAEVGTSNVIDDRAPLPSIQGYELSHEVVAGRKGATEFLDVLRMGPLFILAIGAVRQKNEDPKKVVGLTRNLVRIHIKDTTDPGELLKLINADIFPQLEPKTFVSLLIAVLDPMPGRLSFSRAGLTAPVLVRPARRQHVRLQDFEGMPLGADPGPMFNPTVSSSRLQLEQNDLFVLHSEGIFNVRNRLREPYGEGRFSQVLDRCGLHEAEYFRDKLREKIDLFARAEGALSNGYAVLALKRSTPVSTQLTWSA